MVLQVWVINSKTHKFFGFFKRGIAKKKLWLNLYPRLRSILRENQRKGLAAKLIPFMCSGSHIIQKDCQSSTLNPFVEAVSRCQPGIAIPSALLKYLGKSHNLWHRNLLARKNCCWSNYWKNQHWNSFAWNENRHYF